ncbi:MAG: patatin-like phospholipase family protein [Clostridia bacterium]|nr:patatin-like phospholipase family protein [Clostridia bacterium]
MHSAGLVFAGGGVKGAYQIGVWQALTELGIKISGVAGTSIGSINGALFVQNDIETAFNLWTGITMDKIVNIPCVRTDNLFDIKNIFALIGEVYKNSGIDNAPLERLLNEIIDENKIRNSCIDYGLVTYSLTDRKEIELFKEDIPKGKLVKYMMASACLPGFKTQTIDDKVFIDGGVNNNMPVNMLINRGIRDIIAVDVGGVGISKSADISGINIFTIKCADNIIGTMDFNTENIKRSIKTGYYDCYKTFGRLLGEKYYFNSSDYLIAKARYSYDMLMGMEYAALAFKIDNLAVYKVRSLMSGIVRAYHKADKRYKKMRESLQKENIFDVLGKKKIKLDDGLIIAWIVDLMASKNSDFINNKFVAGILGNNFYAASTLRYLLETGGGFCGCM